jgi:hypothetical protein
MIAAEMDRLGNLNFCQGFVRRKFSLLGNFIGPELTNLLSILAEGVVSEPFLPFSDQGRKGGFATFHNESRESAYFQSRMQ